MPLAATEGYTRLRRTQAAVPYRKEAPRDILVAAAPRHRTQLMERRAPSNLPSFENYRRK